MADERGNTTPLIERPIHVPTAAGPFATVFNAYLAGTSRLRVALQVTDPDGDFAGVFVAARLRDGALGGPHDGQPDYGIWNVAGYLSTTIPDLTFTTTLMYYDVYAVIVYLLDAAGNIRRVEDGDILP